MGLYVHIGKCGLEVRREMERRARRLRMKKIKSVSHWQSLQHGSEGAEK